MKPPKSAPPRYDGVYTAGTAALDETLDALRALVEDINWEVEQIARVCHEVNRAYCQALGDSSQLPWEEAPEWQRQSAINGVNSHISHPDSRPSDSHESWLREKQADGWKYGPVKHPEKKEHPCCVPFEQLPPEQKAKDYLFLAVVRALWRHP